MSAYETNEQIEDALREVGIKELADVFDKFNQEAQKPDATKETLAKIEVERKAAIHDLDLVMRHGIGCEICIVDRCIKQANDTDMYCPTRVGINDVCDFGWRGVCDENSLNTHKEHGYEVHSSKRFQRRSTPDTMEMRKASERGRKILTRLRDLLNQANKKIAGFELSRI